MRNNEKNEWLPPEWLTGKENKWTICHFLIVAIDDEGWIPCTDVSGESDQPPSSKCLIPDGSFNTLAHPRTTQSLASGDT